MDFSITARVTQQIETAPQSPSPLRIATYEQDAQLFMDYIARIDLQYTVLAEQCNTLAEQFNAFAVALESEMLGIAAQAAASAEAAETAAATAANDVRAGVIALTDAAAVSSELAQTAAAAAVATLGAEEWGPVVECVANRRYWRTGEVWVAVVASTGVDPATDDGTHWRRAVQPTTAQQIFTFQTCGGF